MISFSYNCLCRIPKKPTIARHASYHSTTISSNAATSGAGIGNVQNRMLPTSRNEGQNQFSHCREPRTVSIIGAPMTYGQPFVGTDNGPSLLRDAGLLTDLTSLGWRVEDNPDLDFNSKTTAELPSHPNAKNSFLVGKACRQLSDIVFAKAKQHYFPLVLGGDHSIAIGSLSGILRARPDTGVLWIDAHADLNTPTISESGNIHGMPVGLLLNGLYRDHASVPGMEWLTEPEYAAARLDPDSIVYVGLRDVDAAERRIIKELGICAFTMSDIDHWGIGRVMDEAMAYLLRDHPDRPIHVSYDIDSVDPVYAPATGTAVRGGLTFREANYVAEAVVGSGRLASVDLVELNPNLADGSGAKETVEMGLNILTSLLGKSII